VVTPVQAHRAVSTQLNRQGGRDCRARRAQPAAPDLDLAARDEQVALLVALADGKRRHLQATRTNGSARSTGASADDGAPAPRREDVSHTTHREFCSALLDDGVDELGGAGGQRNRTRFLAERAVCARGERPEAACAAARRASAPESADSDAPAVVTSTRTTDPTSSTETKYAFVVAPARRLAR
jgi:hypothetical protein